MPADPFETRERGISRVRTVTASVAAAALLGTGAIVYELAAPASAATQTNDRTGTGDQQQPGSGDDGQFDEQAPGDDGGGTVQPPVQVPAPSGGSGHHASSGGS